jgi:hypothetical protein
MKRYFHSHFTSCCLQQSSIIHRILPCTSLSLLRVRRVMEEAIRCFACFEFLFKSFHFVVIAAADESFAISLQYVLEFSSFLSCVCLELLVSFVSVRAYLETINHIW